MTEHKRLVFGVGVIDTNIELKENGRYINQYRTWRSMIRQSYGENIKGRRIEGLKVCKEWHSFANFKAWYDANHKERFYMSRNLIDPDCKIYSPKTCVFVPYKWGRLFVRNAPDLTLIAEEFERCEKEYPENKELMALIRLIKIRLN
ncbi:hypothetical protein [Photobacterium damselae]|uniref:hypothetical protein n=1 Tax=Photobacterium damselae TaxID=38293 RepID=UPI001F22DFD9|nr:hypothetical protein [Photobacterium damselae]UKA12900.1 hypothetical protein IHC91_21520 [Photobacterium damselae subsp. damselae]